MNAPSLLSRGAMLAPMAGVTDAPFRALCVAYGCAMTVTEMVSAKGYLLAPKDNRAARELLAVDPSEEGRVALQLFGHEPDIMARAADELTATGRYAMLDINMGCPAPKIVGNGEGSALLREPVAAAELAEAVVRASHVPVSVKLRLGFEPGSEAYLLLGTLLEESGVSMLTLHARTRSQLYEGRADWEAIAKLKRRVRIPVVGNGDVTCAQDALAMLERTGCDGVAVGRAAQGNPWIFEQIARAMRGEAPRAIPPEERLSVLLGHAAALAALKGEGVAVREMRRHAAAYVRALPGAAQFRTRLNRVETLAELERLTSAFLLAGCVEP